MKRQIRKNVFESNSSSVHAICIANDNNLYHLPTSLEFKLGEFGWENDALSSPYEKASYLITALCLYNNHNWNNEDDTEYIESKFNEIASALRELDIECYFPTMDKIKSDYYYIDHGYDTIDFVQYVLSDKQHLFNYLFGESFVVTGNDNDGVIRNKMYERDADGWYSKLKAEYKKYTIFKKGN